MKEMEKEEVKIETVVEAEKPEGVAIEGAKAGEL